MYVRIIRIKCFGAHIFEKFGLDFMVFCENFDFENLMKSREVISVFLDPIFSKLERHEFFSFESYSRKLRKLRKFRKLLNSNQKKSFVFVGPI